jgi:hypothetical protein
MLWFEFHAFVPKPSIMGGREIYQFPCPWVGCLMNGLQTHNNCFGSFFFPLFNFQFSLAPDNLRAAPPGAV